MMTLPPIVKNLIIINVLMLLATMVFDGMGLDLGGLLGLHHWMSEAFRPHQFVTYMFMHGGISHLFFNMFALWMFGRILEQAWGSKKFLIYYIITGIGAGIIQVLVTEFRLIPLLNQVPPEMLSEIKLRGYEVLSSGKNYADPILGQLNAMINSTTVGASGSVYGILLAFGMLFPNSEIMLLFFPVPIKAKYIVIVFGLFELFSGIANNPSDNVAHFAHLGGMLFGFILIKYWRKTGSTYL